MIHHESHCGRTKLISPEKVIVRTQNMRRNTDAFRFAILIKLWEVKHCASLNANEFHSALVFLVYFCFQSFCCCVCFASSAAHRYIARNSDTLMKNSKSSLNVATQKLREIIVFRNALLFNIYDRSAVFVTRDEKNLNHIPCRPSSSL